MKFTRQQKQLIQNICDGKIFDILSFAQSSGVCESVRYERSEVERAFRGDPQASAPYYCAKHLVPTPSELIPEADFQESLKMRTRAAEDYRSYTPQLEWTYSRQSAQALGETFSFDFYKGVEVVKDFGALVDFLAVWQLLRDEALILDVPQPVNRETIGLLFEPLAPKEDIPEMYVEEGQSCLSFSDARYLQGKRYGLSERRLQICGEFIGRRIYPAPKLKLFIKRRFRTSAEVQHTNALIAAWVAILVTILAALSQITASMLLSSATMGSAQQAKAGIEERVEQGDPPE